MKNFAKILAVLLTLCMLMGAFMIPTVAADDQSAEAIEPDTSWYTGAETEEIVYELYDAADLLGFAALGNAGVTFKSTTVKLMADIDLNPGWDATTVVDGKEVTLAETPANVWDSIPTFEGIFDGNGKTISGIYSYGTPSIPVSGVKASGGFIDRVVGGEIKNLIVLNSLSVTAPTSDFGTTRLNAGGFIGHAEDATLTTLYIDMDAWMVFDYHCNFGGMISSMGTSRSAYDGKVEDIVFAGTVGAITPSSNDYTSTGSRTTKYRFGGVIAASIDWMGTKNISLTMKNIANIGSLYWPGNASGDDILCYTGGGSYNVGLALDNAGFYYYYEEAGAVSENPGNSLDDVAKDVLNKSASSNAEDTYGDAGWVDVEFANGAGLETVLLPGAVYEMVSASDFEVNTSGSNVAVEADSSWYTGAENKEIVYYLYDAADLLGFAKLGNKGTTFNGATVKLMADIDLNPGWDATTVVEGTTVTLADAAANVWDSIPTFEGILDGNGHTISGIYSYGTPSIPASGVKASGGFIDRVVGGEIKDLVVLNSLSVTAPTSSFGSTRLNAGGFIGHAEDATLTTLYVDMDSWLKSDYHANYGGMISAMGTSGSAYAGEVRDIVFAGSVGAISTTSNEYNASGNRSAKQLRVAGVIAANLDWMGTKDIKLSIENLAFIGALYWPGSTATGDDVICYTGGGSYNVGFGVDNVGKYYYYESAGAADLPTPNVDLDSVADNIFNNKNAANYGNAEDTYADAGWVSVEHANGVGLEEILLPGSVVDMLNANSSNVYFQKSNDGTKVRIIGVVDLSEEELENFSMLGFDVAMRYNGTKYTKTFTTSMVYTSLMVDGTPVEASEYKGTYFYAIEITGLDAAASDVVFEVTGITVHAGETTEHAFGSRTITISAS